ncbi:MAG: PIN domain-containing protein [Lentisphaerae bacterium]|nr:PIN domain-containing protein [Lentisphaerota bacterium]
MTMGLDTSVVLRLLTGEPNVQARKALQWLREAKASGSTPVISDLVASEVYFALQHHFGVSKVEALRNLSLFLASGDVTADGVVATVLATPGLASAKPGFVDRLIHEQYLRGGAAGMVTFEKAARALAKVKLLDI